jgi:hypothetical protein
LEKADSDIDNIDFDNFKGIYFEDDPNRKYQDPETGCHFEYFDLCRRLAKLKKLRKKLDEQLGLPPESEEEDIIRPRNENQLYSLGGQADSKGTRGSSKHRPAQPGKA